MSNRKPRNSRSTARRRGATAVEAALVLPVVITFLFGILEYGRYVMTLQMVTNAAHKGAHYAQRHIQPVTISGTTYGNATADVTNKVNLAMANKPLSGQTVSVDCTNSLGANPTTWTNAQVGECVRVRITGNYPVILGKMLFLPTTIPVTATAVVPVENN